MTEQVGGALGREFVRMIGPVGPELGCEECFDQLDAYVELELTGVSADAAMPAMRTHLEGCSVCRDDHDSLLAFARTDPERRLAATSKHGRPLMASMVREGKAFEVWVVDLSKVLS